MEAKAQQNTRRLGVDGTRAISAARSRFAVMPWANALRNQKPHVLELSLVLGAYLVYVLTRGLVYSDLDGKALQNAYHIVSAERSLGIFWESGWQSWLLDNLEWLVLFFNWAYIFTYWPVILVVGLALYIANRPRYYYYRTVVVVNLAFALLIFMLFPVTSPFDLSEYFVNSIQTLGPAFYGSSEMAGYYNTNAAMPSLHFSWTVILGVLFIRTFKGRFKLLGAAYPLMTFFAITITGNHFILDAAAGGVLAVAAFAVMELGFRRGRLARAYALARGGALASWERSRGAINGHRDWDGVRARALALYEEKREQRRTWLSDQRDRAWRPSWAKVLALYEGKRDQGRKWLLTHWARARENLTVLAFPRLSFQRVGGWPGTWPLRVKLQLVMFLRRHLSPRNTVTR